jgi:transcriptional regulator with XRE-family HTH domain
VSRLGYSIKILREARGITSAVLAKKARISATYLSLIERGDRIPPSETLRRLAAALQIDLCVLEACLPTAPALPRSKITHELAASLRRLLVASEDLKRRLES